MQEQTFSDSILIVDDQQPMRLLLLGLLRKLKFADVRQAASGSRALEMMKQELPALVYLDLEMPDMHGLEVLKGLRELTDGDSVFVVVQTGNATRDNIERARELNVDDVLAKPYSLQKLEVSIARYRAAGAA